MAKTKKGDFIELDFTGYSDGKIFDSNIKEDLQKISKDPKPRDLLIIIGEQIVVQGLDNALEDKEVGKEYKISLKPKEAFGERRQELIKTIPLKAFSKHNVDPRPGVTLFLDNYLVKIIAVSGARVTADFNNPLAGRNIEYKFKIRKIIEDEKEKVDAFFKIFFKSSQSYKIEEKTVFLESDIGENPFLDFLREKFQALINKELKYAPKVENKK